MKLRYIAFGVLGFIVALSMILSMYTVDSGTVKVVKRMGRVIDETSAGGPYMKIPFVDTATEVSLLTLGNAVDVRGVTSDQQTLTVSVDIQWSIAPGSRKGVLDLEKQQDGIVDQFVGDASQILVTYGSRADFDRIILDTRITKVTNDFVSTMKLEDIIKNRAKVTLDIERTVKEQLAEYPIVVDGVQVRSITPSHKYTEAIEAKQIAEVTAQKAVEEAKGINTLAEANKAKVQMEAEAIAYGKQVVFEAEAAGIKAKADALKQAGPSYIELTRVTQWDGKYPLVMGSDAGVQFGVGAKIGENVAKGIK